MYAQGSIIKLLGVFKVERCPFEGLSDKQLYPLYWECILYCSSG